MNQAVAEILHIPNSGASPLYVVGFLFRDNGREVALVRKNRPSAQKGLLNGVGGKVETGETPFSAMPREAIEEMGVSVRWEPYRLLKPARSKNAIVVFRSFEPATIRTMESEPVAWFNVRDLRVESCVEYTQPLIQITSLKY